MHIDARINQVVADAIQNASARAQTIRQTGELPVRIVHRVCENVERHPYNVRREIAIEIEVPGSDPDQCPEERDAIRRKPSPDKKTRQLETDFTIEMKIEKSLDFSRLVG